MIDSFWIEKIIKFFHSLDIINERNGSYITCVCALQNLKVALFSVFSVSMNLKILFSDWVNIFPKGLRYGIHIFSNDPICFFEFLANDCSRKLFGAITVSCCIEIPSSVSSAFGKSYRKSEKFLKLCFHFQGCKV